MKYRGRRGVNLVINLDWLDVVCRLPSVRTGSVREI